MNSESRSNAEAQSGTPRIQALSEVAPALLRRWIVGALVVGVAGTVILIIGGIFDPAQFFRAYLAAYLFCLNLAIGSLIVLMVYHITGGAWGFLTRRLLEGATQTLPLLALGFVPIAFGVRYLYPFARPDLVANNKLLQLQHGYMNEPFWWIRAAVYFVVWMGIALLLNRFSRAEDRTGDRWFGWAMNGVSGFGGVLIGVTLHFAAMDWILALEPEYHSTITGPLVASQGLVAGFALILVVFTTICERAPLAQIVGPKTLTDLGNLLLTFIILFSYLLWFEFMLTWIANMQVDIVWYGVRTRGFWAWLLTAEALLQFVVPFVLLLQRPVKRHPAMLRVVCVLCLVMQALFPQFQILPSFRPTGIGTWWMSLVAPIGLGGLWLAYYLIRVRSLPLLPSADPHAADAIHARQSDEHEAEWEESLAHG
jgi:Ni/Fe-hydrogenase subunit HybB-like protein